MLWKGQQGHDLRGLSADVAAFASVAGAKTARYFKTATSGVPQAAITGWTPGMRYRSPGISLADAQAWCLVADTVFHETVAQMQLDGVL